jgi:predicted nucleic acid-binding Zn ribbon protein
MFNPPKPLATSVAGGLFFCYNALNGYFETCKIQILGVNLSTTSEYKCHSCGYTADVWDAPDRAPIATVDTRHCLGCKSLVEVPIEFHGGGLIEDPDVVPSFLNRCPDCNSANVHCWDAMHACPRCGEQMNDSGSSSIFFVGW